MAKNIVRCKFCNKQVTVETEEKVPAFGVIFYKYSCGHSLTEELVAVAPPSEGKKFVCRNHLVVCENGTRAEHEECQYLGNPAIVEIPIERHPVFSRAMPFQKTGVEFLENANFNAALLDEMGLGKTIQLLLALRHHKEKLTPTLIVVKASLKLNWAKEMVNNQWVCDINDMTDYPFILMDGKSSLIPGFRYYIVPMSLLEKYKTELANFGFKLLLVDESQAFSNTNTKRTKALLEIAANIPHRICASGTPVLNRASEYFPTLNLIKPAHWNNYASFIRTWIEAEQQPSGSVKLKGIKNWKRDEFFAKTSGYILRRKKRDVLLDLPKFSRHFMVVDISDSAVKNAYNQESQLLSSYLNSQSYAQASGFEKAGTILGYMMRMRHLCGIAKSVICVEQAIDFMNSTDEDQKLIIGCHHDDVMDNLKLGLKEWNPVVLGSGIDDIERTNKIEEFKKPGRRICLAKILASGEGLNLQFCSNMIVLERQWNPGKEEQFEARIDRYGQLEPTVADYIIAKNTVDEDFSEMVEEKRRICGGTLDPDFDFEMNPELLSMLAERAASRRL
jgi:SNF2 family DNA or RNA helicase